MIDELTLPPQNLEAELGVLGAALRDNSCLHDVSGIVKARDFYRDSHQLIYSSILELYAVGTPIDAITLGEELKRKGVFDRVGGDDTLSAILDSVATSALASYHAEIVREKAIARRLVESAHETLRESYSHTKTAGELLEAAERRLFEIAEDNTSSSLVNLSVAIGQACDRTMRRNVGQAGGLPTGFIDLDAMIDGLHETKLIVLAGRPAMGKSLIAFNIADHIADTLGNNALFVSLEMSAIELGERALIARSGVPAHAVQTGRGLSHRDFESLSKTAFDAAEGSRLTIDDTPSRSMTQIAAIARKMKASQGLSLLVVDYMQLVEPDSGRDSRQEQIAKISRRLKTLARELKVPVVALSQLNRDVEKREDKRPKLADLRESGAIEQDADIVLMVHRPEIYDPNDKPGIAELIVAKNRGGRTGVVELAFKGGNMRFASLDTRQEPDFDYTPAADDF